MAIPGGEDHHEVVTYPGDVLMQVIELLLRAASDHSDRRCVARRIDDVSPVLLERFCERMSVRRETSVRDIEIGWQGEVSAHRDRAVI